MYSDDITVVIQAAKAKMNFLKYNPIGFFISSMLAGVFIGFGVLLTSTIGGLLVNQPYARTVMGLSFGIALSLVIIAGAELFTGNNFILTVAILGKSMKWREAIKLWMVCFVGNWIGAIILAAIFSGGGLATGAVGEFIAVSSATKMKMPFIHLFLRGILCNVLVCLAIWSSFRCKSESGKLIMIFWCLFAFITSGFEHSIANMTLLTVGLIAPFGADISLGGYFYNIIVVSIGNMFGGIVCIALPYFIMSQRSKE